MIAKTKVLQDTAATQARTNRTIEMLRKLTTEQSGYEVNMHNFRLISPAEKKKVYEPVQQALKGILLDWIFSYVRCFYDPEGSGVALVSRPGRLEYNETPESRRFVHGAWHPILLLCLPYNHLALSECENLKVFHRNIHTNIIGKCVATVEDSHWEEATLPKENSMGSDYDGLFQLNLRKCFRAELQRLGFLRQVDEPCGPYPNTSVTGDISSSIHHSALSVQLHRLSASVNPHSSLASLHDAAHGTLLQLQSRLLLRQRLPQASSIPLARLLLHRQQASRS